MAQVVLKELNKKYDEVHAVKDVNLTIRDKEFMVLVGPSGCGKTTALRSIAGLEEISSGTITIGGKIVNDLPPKDRDIAMVFQNYALYPHMTVEQNLAFGLQQRKTPKDEIKRRVTDVAKMLGLEQYLKRKPAALSGGQRQPGPGRVDDGRVPLDHPAPLQPAHPLVRRGHRETSPPGQLGEADPAILAQQRNDPAVNLFHPVTVVRRMTSPPLCG